MGSETTCSLWEEGRCFRAVCKFRHMEITKNRKEIPCYWEKQPAGCQKPHCAFYHEKPRCIEGVFVQPDKNAKKEEEQHHEEQTVPAASVNPQLRSVKTETQEPVPSPTHPPVVINPADDDEDEDDQFSEEGEEGKGGPAPRKLPKSDDSLNFGVSTLEEIRLRKALKASMKRAGYPLQTTQTSTSVEKENIQTLFRPDVFDSRDAPGGARVSVTRRLGRKINSTDLRSAEDVPLKRSLAKRLGRVVGVDQPFLPPHTALKPVKERLGLLCDPAAPTQPAESSAASQKVPELIHIKTLEEIKQEKAVRSQPENQKHTRATEASSGTKRAVASICSVKTFSEILHAKKKRQEEELEQKPRPEVNHTAERDQSPEEAHTAGPEVTNVGRIRVKTLEEIRMEKAARSQLQQAADAENGKRSDAEESGAKKPRLLRIKNLAPQTSSIAAEKKPHRSPSPESQTSNNIKVKTFEEIMREKRLRKQEMLEQGKVGEPEPSHNQDASSTLKRKAPSSPRSSSSPSSKTPRVPVHKPITLRSAAAPPGNGVVAPETAAAVVAAQSSSPQRAGTRSSSRVAPDKKASTAPSPREQPRVTGASAAEEATDTNQEPPELTADTKERPKLNVKPSVMKPAVLVKPGQRRRGAQQSAVVAVKPLNSPSALKEEPRNSDTHTLPSTGVDAPRSHFTQLESASSPAGEELQTVPVFKQSPGPESSLPTSGATTRESCTVPQSSAQKTPSQPRSRRLSTAASRAASTSSAAASTSAMDDFEELINEFTDDHLDDDVDPSIGEDDLLQELSEMIDS